MAEMHLGRKINICCKKRELCLVIKMCLYSRFYSEGFTAKDQKHKKQHLLLEGDILMPFSHRF